MTIKFAKLDPKAIIPSKRDEDAGYDIYACIDEDIIIPPNETVMVPTGIASAFDPGYVAILKERGSTGSRGIGPPCGVVDSGYRGQWFVALTNHTNGEIKLAVEERPASCFHGITYPVSKAIAQAVFVAVPDSKVEEIAPEELASIKSERGAGKLGSSEK